MSIYGYNYHCPLLLDDLLILILLHHPKYHSKLNTTRTQSLFHIGFVILCHHILRNLYEPNSKTIFESLIERPINRELNDRITAINDLLDEQLSHTPYLKDVVWDFVGIPLENIDVDELIQTKRYVESLKRVHINTEQDKQFDFLKEIMYRKYYRILQSICNFNALYLRRDPDFTDLDHNESRFSWLMWWSALRVFVHLCPRIIAPVWFYCIAGIDELNVMDEKSEILKYGQIVICREPFVFALRSIHYILRKLFQKTFDDVLVIIYESLKAILF